MLENREEHGVILLNKPFLGGWLDENGHIAHEIIDFLQTDDGQYYVYNNPRGYCPENIWVEGTSDLARTPREKYVGKYLVLTGKAQKKDFDILYVIELAEKLHRYHAPNKNTALLRENQEGVKEIIRRRNIRYNGKYLDEIHQNDDTLMATFRGGRIYRAVEPIAVTGLSELNFQRNKGYLYDDQRPEDYQKVLTIIENGIRDGALQEFSPRSVNKDQIGELEVHKTFIDLIRQEDNEQIFTNLLYDVLSQGEVLKHFCEKFRGGHAFSSNENFRVSRETGVVNGRMDVCAESESQWVIIENKINSGLNGLRPADNTSQLSTYYRWGRAKSVEPLCFVVAPNYRYAEIVREIREKDPAMAEVYQVKTYGEIAEFMEDEVASGGIPADYPYYALLPQVIDAFKNLSYLTKEDLYAREFLKATGE